MGPLRGARIVVTRCWRLRLRLLPAKEATPSPLRLLSLLRLGIPAAAPGCPWLERAPVVHARVLSGIDLGAGHQIILGIGDPCTGDAHFSCRS